MARSIFQKSETDTPQADLDTHVKKNQLWMKNRTILFIYVNESTMVKTYLLGFAK